MAPPESSPVESGSSTPPTGEATRSPDDAMLARRAAAATVLGDLLIDDNRPEGQKRFDQHGDELSLENLEQLALVAPEVSEAIKFKQEVVDAERQASREHMAMYPELYNPTKAGDKVREKTRFYKNPADRLMHEAPHAVPEFGVIGADVLGLGPIGRGARWLLGGGAAESRQRKREAAAQHDNELRRRTKPYDRSGERKLEVAERNKAMVDEGNRLLRIKNAPQTLEILGARMRGQDPFRLGIDPGAYSALSEEYVTHMKRELEEERAIAAAQRRKGVGEVHIALGGKETTLGTDELEILAGRAAPKVAAAIREAETTLGRELSREEYLEVTNEARQG